MKFDTFMRTYLASRALENRKTQDLSEYLLREGNDPRPTYGKTIAAAREAYLFGGQKDGVTADALERRGLLSSGYAAFLADESRADLRRAEREAADVYREEMTEEIGNYRDFLAREEKEQEALRSTLENRLLSMNTTDREAAYLYLLAGGVSDTDARATAESVISLVSDKKREGVIENALHYGYDYDTAYLYAITEGLTPEDAKAVATLAEEAFRHGGSIYAYFKEHFSPTPLS